MTLLDPRNGPAHDLPPCGRIRRTYVLASTPRTGSTLLARLLWAAGGLGAPKEYLNPMQLRDWTVRRGGVAGTCAARLSGPAIGLVGKLPPWDARALQAHLDHVARHRTGPTGWFGLKLHDHHLRQWFARTGTERLPPALTGASWIRITRDDRVAQAISWVRALRSGRWASHQQGHGILSRLPARLRPDLSYDRRAIAARLTAIHASEAAWDARLAALGGPALHLTYEAVSADPCAAVQAVFATLDQPLPAPDVLNRLVAATGMSRQADETSRAWKARFVAEQHGG